jgi:hypothetical protein
VAADLSGLEGVLASPQIPQAHAHAISDVTGLQTALDGKQNVGQGGGGVGTTDVVLVNTSFIWTNMPAADTELAGATSSRFRVDLTGYTEYRWMVNVNVAGVAGADLRVQYSTDDVSYTNLSSEIDIGSLGRKITAWAALPAGARADVWLRIMGKQGNGTADPNLSQLRLQVR